MAWRRGDRELAARLCHRILVVNPAAADARHLLGVLDLQAGRTEAGLVQVEQALQLAPGNPSFLTSRGNALLALGRAAEALADYTEVLTRQPDRAVNHGNLGCALEALGRPAEALAAFERALALAPEDPGLLTSCGITLASLGRLTEAEALHRQALAARPGFVEAWTNLAAVLTSLGRPIEAIECCRAALERAPGFVQARHNCAQALFDAGLPAEALQMIEELRERGLAAAKSLALQARVLRGLGRDDEAITLLQQALVAQPDDSLLVGTLGDLALATGRLPLALEAYTRLNTAPDAPVDAVGRLLEARQQSCDWSGYDAAVEAIRAGLAAGRRPIVPFPFFAVDSTAAEQRLCAELTEAVLAGPNVAPRPVTAPVAGRRIRVAYLSPDFRLHPVANQVVALLESHDRSRFEITGIALEADDGSPVAARIRSACEHFVEGGREMDAELERRLHEIAPDVAIDLAGFTLGARPRLFARRIAPVQVSFLGFPGTTGSRFHDYLVADRWVIPAGDEGHYSETVVRLPGSYQPVDATPPPPCTETRASAGLPPDGFVFCCFNNRFKITPAWFSRWMDILAEVPGSVLWLAHGPADSAAALRRAAASHDIDPQRIVFSDRRETRLAHLARIVLADLFLDTLPFNAHATASDALVAGLPVLTCAGSTFAARVAAGMVTAAGLPELVVTSPDDYVRLAVELARDRPRLATLRERLRRNRDDAALFDPKGYADAFESALELMLAQCGDSAASAFSVLSRARLADA